MNVWFLRRQISPVHFCPSKAVFFFASNRQHHPRLAAPEGPPRPGLHSERVFSTRLLQGGGPTDVHAAHIELTDHVSNASSTLHFDTKWNFPDGVETSVWEEAVLSSHPPLPPLSPHTRRVLPSSPVWYGSVLPSDVIFQMSDIDRHTQPWGNSEAAKMCYWKWWWRLETIVWITCVVTLLSIKAILAEPCCLFSIDHCKLKLANNWQHLKHIVSWEDLRAEQNNMFSINNDHFFSFTKWKEQKMPYNKQLTNLDRSVMPGNIKLSLSQYVKASVWYFPAWPHSRSVSNRKEYRSTSI